jgi:hypothetical protein
VLLVNEQDFKKLASETQIISKQIYSIQKNFIEVSFFLKSIETYNTNRFNPQDFSIFYGSDLNISNDNCRKSNLTKIEDCIRKPTDCKPSTSSSSNPAANGNDKKKPEQKPDTIVKTEPKSVAPVTTHEQDHKPMEVEVKTEKKTTESKPQVESKDTRNSSKTSSDPTAKKPGNSIASMFSKQKESLPRKTEKADEEPMIVEQPAQSVDVKMSSSSESLKKDSKLRQVIEDLKIEDDDVVMEPDEDSKKKKKESK